jgi:hypothetical protein
MQSRALCIVGLVACASAPAYRVSVREHPEVGEDPTIAVAVRDTSNDHAVLVITRPDGSTVRQDVPLDAPEKNVRFGSLADRASEPTFTAPGDYRVELRANEAILASQQIRVAVDRLTRLFADGEVAGFDLVTRFTRSRANKRRHWKTYGAVYEDTVRPGTRIEVVIEEPGDSLVEAWKPYEEEGPLAVIEGYNVRFRERTHSVSASWISGKRIVAMRASTLEDFQRGFIAHFLSLYPSNL